MTLTVNFPSSSASLLFNSYLYFKASTEVFGDWAVETLGDEQSDIMSFSYILVWKLAYTLYYIFIDINIFHYGVSINESTLKKFEFFKCIYVHCSFGSFL
jgi:hypothetical protein